MKKKTFGLLLASLFYLAGCDLLAPIRSTDSSESNQFVDSLDESTYSSGNARFTSEDSKAFEDSNSLHGEPQKEKIKIWVSEVNGVANHFQNLATQWAEDNDVDYAFEVLGIPEHDAGEQMLVDISAGADIYCFAQDQFSRLIQAGALSVLGPRASSWVEENNTEDSVRGVTSDDSIYAYPLVADNGYFMYYDKRFINEEHIDSLEDIVEDCEKAGMNISFEVCGSAWYTASFFMAYGDEDKPLCHSNWLTDDRGAFTDCDDTWNSDNGVIAAKGMQHLVKSDYWRNSSSVHDFTVATPSAVVVSGTWDYSYAKEALGNNMGVADLPSFTVDGKSYHLGSYAGYKLMGVKPQTDAVKAANLHKLVQYMTSYDAEMTRLSSFGFNWAPSNKQAQASDQFKANPAFVALAEQNKYATIQGYIHGSWWEIGKIVGISLKEANCDDEAAIREILSEYEDSLKNLLHDR